MRGMRLVPICSTKPETYSLEGAMGFNSHYPLKRLLKWAFQHSRNMTSYYLDFFLQLLIIDE